MRNCWLSVAGAAFLFLWASPVLAQCYMSTPAGYQRMGGASRIGPYPSWNACQSVNQSQMGGQGSCSCTSGPSRGTGAGTDVRQQELLRQQREAEERARREAEERRRKQREVQEAERRAKEREEAARQEFRRGQAEALRQMKGAGAGTLELKSGTPTLGLKDPNPTGGLALKEGTGRAISSEWKQAHCGMWIARHAVPAAKKGDVAEVRYLSRQALKSFSGGPPELDCPAAPPPPAPVGREITGRDSPLFKFHATLLAAAEREADVVHKAQEKILKAGLRKRELQAEIRARQREAARLEAEVRAEKKAEEKTEKKAAIPSGAPATDDKKEAKKRAMAEALAALEKARRLAAEVDTLSASAQKEKEAADAKLDELARLGEQVQAAPGEAAALAAKIAN
jgi:hypothetical protein